MNRINRAGLTVSVIAFGALTLPAAEQDTAAPQTKKTTASPNSTSPKSPPPAGLIAVKDPITGELRQATAEEIGALSNAGGAGGNTARSPEPVAILRPDGMTSLTLGPDQMSFSVVMKTADGKLVESCVTGEDAAKKALTGATQTLPARKEKLNDK